MMVPDVKAEGNGVVGTACIYKKAIRRHYVVEQELLAKGEVELPIVASQVLICSSNADYGFRE